MGRSRHTKGGQHAANKNQNKKARRTVKSVKKAVGNAAKTAGNIAKSIGRGAASYAANHPGVSSYNRKTRDMSKLSPQSRRRYERLSAKTGRDYSQRIPTMKINLSADRLAQFAGVADKGWYKGITNRFPGIKKLQINKQLYSNPMKKGWHSSQVTGRGQGVTPQAATKQQLIDRVARSSHPEFIHSRREAAGLSSLRADPSQDIGRMYQNILGRKHDQEGLDYWTNEFKSGRQNMNDIRKQFVQSGEFGGRSDADRSAALEGIKQRRGRGGRIGQDPDMRAMLPYFPDGAPKPPASDMGPQQDWLSSLYSSHNISGGKLDQEARDYWSNEAKTKGRDAVSKSIIGTSKAAGTYGGRKKPRPINVGGKRRRRRAGGLLSAAAGIASGIGLRGGS